MSLLKDEIDQRLPYAVFFVGIDSDKRIPGSDPNIELVQELRMLSATVSNSDIVCFLESVLRN